MAWLFGKRATALLFGLLWIFLVLLIRYEHVALQHHLLIYENNPKHSQNKTNDGDGDGDGDNGNNKQQQEQQQQVRVEIDTSLTAKSETQTNAETESGVATIPPVSHNPDYFSNVVSVETLIRRMNMANVHMGCHVAAWVYVGYLSKYKRFNDCRDAIQCAYGVPHHQRLKQREFPIRNKTPAAAAGDDAAILSPLFTARQQQQQQVLPYDTIYVPFVKLEHFVNTTLLFSPEGDGEGRGLAVDIVLISGQTIKVDAVPRHVVEAILQHPRIVVWFLQNIPIYITDRELQQHPKLKPWPYGIHYLDHPTLLQEMVKDYDHQDNDGAPSPNRSTFIHVGYVSKRNNMSVRRRVPSSEEKVNQTQFYQLLHQTQYVVSPDGDRPECYRHYEALALGAVPITQLDPLFFPHLQTGPVIYREIATATGTTIRRTRRTRNRRRNNGAGFHNWNLTWLEEVLPRQPVVNRRLVFAEYWMEYVERELQRPVRWWDPVQQHHATLQDITTRVHEQQEQERRAASEGKKTSIPLRDLEFPRMIFCGNDDKKDGDGKR